MGFFSWLTSDTQKSIRNCFARHGATKVYLVTPNNEHIYEDDYQGYGVFGGYDAYALLAKWNCPELCTGNPEKDRLIGIELFFSGEKIEYPLKFSQRKTARYEDLAPAKECPRQGYF